MMQEIPTVVVSNMPPQLLEHGDYVVLNRPYAVGGWAEGRGEKVSR